MANRNCLGGLAIVSVLALVAGTALAATPAKAPNSMEKPAGKGALDGRFFKGELGQEGQTAGKACGIMFRDGKIHIHGEKGENMMVAAYTTTEANGTITFMATTTGAKEGKMEWQGTVTGDDLQATVTATKEGGAPTQMWFKGKKAAMPEHHAHQGKGGEMTPHQPPAGK
jgi:hypothetical protein